MSNEYQKAIDDFNEADMQYQKHEAAFRAAFAAELDKLEQLLEDRNAKLATAQKAMRQEVQLKGDNVRGPDGSATQLDYGLFHVTSVTKRSFDGNTLYRLLSKDRPDILAELQNLTVMERDGSVSRAFHTVVEVNYQKVLEFLRERGLDQVINAAYDERESTPMVKGPKRLMRLGEKEK